jgi:single-strand DNA-binding protein
MRVEGTLSIQTREVTMKGSSYVQLIGSLTRDSELRYTPSGLAILEVNVAGNQSVPIRDGAKEVPFYIRSKVMGAYAEALVNDLTEGMVVAVDGRLDYRAWEDAEGQKRSAVEVFASSITTLAGDFEFIKDSRGQRRLVGGTNTVTLMGNLVRDAELRYTANGNAVTRLTVAINERWSGRGGKGERTHYIDITAWREVAEKAAELVKGAPVRVVGRITNETWEDTDGNKRYATRVEATEVYAVARPEGKAATQPKASKKLDIDKEFPPEDELPF